ncbi:hypothetical protein A4D02_26575 [Niastella koreensis]|uniref:Anti-FecI sigma factor, FecR n=2 Tax=Niastella koreensis TaxID=354356 RepID=G8TEI3_NIAKG|nr:FecR family protein [Niastella koreensis]AEV99405.1 anti-FecI sigma factor, FecR [Niastella koreensis GR20-10]OQP50008.1 hypothetical protein A4D02_26575 [Niastella koreensis]
MATTNNRLAELAFKRLTHDLSETESFELNRILQEPGKQKLFEEMMDPPRMEAEVKKLEEADRHMPASWQQIKAAYHFNNKSIGWKRYARVAAVVLPLAGIAAWYFFIKPAAQTTATVTPAPAKTQYASNEPKSEKAVWKRAAGLAVSLDDLKNGVAYSSGVPVTKNDSELVYSSARRSDIPLPDTVQTLRGGYYRLRLPDGSKVVLNSASTVFFAAAFGGNDRQVSINGEAWFEVAKDARPFYVHASGMKIQVYGTRFNVQAYPDEDVKTSLLEGSVKVTAGKQNLSLKPGEQAVLTRKKKLEKVTDSSAIKKAIAWKNGAFLFENDDLRTILDQLGRRYNLDVEYKGDLPNKTFDGTFYRKDPVEYILGVLQERTGIRFIKEGNKIIIKP